MCSIWTYIFNFEIAFLDLPPDRAGSNDQVRRITGKDSWTLSVFDIGASAIDAVA